MGVLLAMALNERDRFKEQRDELLAAIDDVRSYVWPAQTGDRLDRLYKLAQHVRDRGEQ